MLACKTSAPVVLQATLESYNEGASAFREELS